MMSDMKRKKNVGVQSTYQEWNSFSILVRLVPAMSILTDDNTCCKRCIYLHIHLILTSLCIVIE